MYGIPKRIDGTPVFVCQPFPLRTNHVLIVSKSTVVHYRTCRFPPESTTAALGLNCKIKFFLPVDSRDCVTMSHPLSLATKTGEDPEGYRIRLRRRQSE